MTKQTVLAKAIKLLKAEVAAKNDLVAIGLGHWPGRSIDYLSQGIINEDVLTMFAVYRRHYQEFLPNLTRDNGQGNKLKAEEFANTLNWLREHQPKPS